MDIQTMITFFMWCTIINGSLLALWTLFLMFAPDLMLRSQKMVLQTPKENFNVIMYSFLGLFKIFFLIFNVVPYIALLIIG